MEIPSGLVNYLFVGVTGLLGWFASVIWNATQELKDDLAKLKEEIPKTYLLKEDYKDDIKEIKEMLKEITKELKNKEDKIIR